MDSLIKELINAEREGIFTRFGGNNSAVRRYDLLLDMNYMPDAIQYNNTVLGLIQSIDMLKRDHEELIEEIDSYYYGSSELKKRLCNDYDARILDMDRLLSPNNKTAFDMDRMRELVLSFEENIKEIKILISNNILIGKDEEHLLEKLLVQTLTVNSMDIYNTELRNIFAISRDKNSAPPLISYLSQAVETQSALNISDIKLTSTAVDKKGKGGGSSTTDVKYSELIRSLSSRELIFKDKERALEDIKNNDINNLVQLEDKYSEMILAKNTSVCGERVWLQLLNIEILGITQILKFHNKALSKEYLNRVYELLKNPSTRIDEIHTMNSIVILYLRKIVSIKGSAMLKSRDKYLNWLYSEIVQSGYTTVSEYLSVAYILCQLNYEFMDIPEHEYIKDREIKYVYDHIYKSSLNEIKRTINTKLSSIYLMENINEAHSKENITARRERMKIEIQDKLNKLTKLPTLQSEEYIKLEYELQLYSDGNKISDDEFEIIQRSELSLQNLNRSIRAGIIPRLISEIGELGSNVDIRYDSFLAIMEQYIALSKKYSEIGIKFNPISVTKEAQRYEKQIHTIKNKIAYLPKNDILLNIYLDRLFAELGVKFRDHLHNIGQREYISKKEEAYNIYLTNVKNSRRIIEIEISSLESAVDKVLDLYDIDIRALLNVSSLVVLPTIVKSISYVANGFKNKNPIDFNYTDIEKIPAVILKEYIAYELKERVERLHECVESNRHLLSVAVNFPKILKIINYKIDVSSGAVEAYKSYKRELNELENILSIEASTSNSIKRLYREQKEFTEKCEDQINTYIFNPLQEKIGDEKLEKILLDDKYKRYIRILINRLSQFQLKDAELEKEQEKNRPAKLSLLSEFEIFAAKVRKKNLRFLGQAPELLGSNIMYNQNKELAKFLRSHNRGVFIPHDVTASILQSSNDRFNSKPPRNSSGKLSIF